MRYWTVRVEEGTKRLVPGYMHSRDCNLKFKTREECLHECEMQQIIRDLEGKYPEKQRWWIKDQLRSFTMNNISLIDLFVLIEFGLVDTDTDGLTEKGFNLLLYLHK